MQFGNCIRLLYRLLSVVASRQELNLKKSVADQMERALKEQKQEIETRDTQSAQLLVIYCTYLVTPNRIAAKLYDQSDQF